MGAGSRWCSVLALAVAAAAPSSAQVFNNGMPSGFTCVGTCATSGADGMVTLAPNSGHQFGYVSSLGGPWANPLGIDSTTNGSVLTSPFFTATAGEQMSFWFNYISSDGGPFNDYGYVRLLGGSGGPLILFTARTTPNGNTVPGFGLPGIAPGVFLSPASTPVIAGAPSFSPLGQWTDTCYDVGCGYTGWIAASYVIPTAGTYQLDFGVYNLLDDLWDSALAVDYTNSDGSGVPTVAPEPTSFVLLASGLFLVGGVAHRRRRR